MPITFEKAKNGSLTCAFNGRLLHSKYNPEREAASFVASLNLGYEAQYIVILEPLLSYCAEPLRRRFPKAALCAVRFFGNLFAKQDSLFDYTFDINNLEKSLFDVLGEEGLLMSFFTSWTPISTAAAETEKKAWFSIKEAVKKASSSLITHEYFAKRWFKNSLILSENLTSSPSLPRLKCPVVITASGRSLEGSLEKLRNLRSRFFLISLSSSLPVLLHHSITPDLVMQTDGGYYAKKHLKKLSFLPKIPLALAAEGAAPACVIKNSPLIPLTYDDGYESSLFSSLAIQSSLAKRNGTVSGSALELSLKITSGDVYIAGLDLAASPSFQHARPNELESENAAKDFRLKPLATRLTASMFSSSSLSVYKNWFIQNSFRFKDRAFRLSNNYRFASTLGYMRDVNFDFFEKRLPASAQTASFSEATVKIKKEEIRKFVLENSASCEWLHYFSPSKFLSYKKNKENRDEILQKMKEENEKFVREILHRYDL